MIRKADAGFGCQCWSDCQHMCRGWAEDKCWSKNEDYMPLCFCWSVFWFRSNFNKIK